MALEKLKNQNVIRIQQRKELVELVGFESRNKYEVLGSDNLSIGFVAEQGKGTMEFLMRYFLGHWRTFEFHIFDENRQQVATAKNPFRFYFRELQLYNNSGTLIGEVKRQFAIFYKKFIFKLPSGESFEVSSPFWKIWTFPVLRNGMEVSVIRKKWSGGIKEILTDADNFEIEYKDPNLSLDARILLLAGGVYVDIQYFERRARN